LRERAVIRRESKIDNSGKNPKRPLAGASALSPIVGIAGIKRFAERNLPSDSILRHLLLEEKDRMDRSEFLAKMDLWLRLFRMEFSGCIHTKGRA